MFLRLIIIRIDHNLRPVCKVYWVVIMVAGITEYQYSINISQASSIDMAQDPDLSRKEIKVGEVSKVQVHVSK